MAVPPAMAAQPDACGGILAQLLRPTIGPYLPLPLARELAAPLATAPGAPRSYGARSLWGLVFLARFTLLSMGSETTLTDVVRFVVLYIVLPLSTNVVEGQFLELRIDGVLGSCPETQ